MISTTRQLQEKCREQHRDLYMIFIDVTKAFDCGNRQVLWQVLSKIGYPDKFVKIIASFHKGMQGQVIDGGELSDMFAVTNGIKQGCVVAAILFSIFFSMMLLIAFKDCDLGVPIQFRTHSSVFNLRRFQALTKTSLAVIRDLLYADDCALVAHSLADAQQLFDRFHAAAVRFGLTVSLKKTKSCYSQLATLHRHSRSSRLRTHPLRLWTSSATSAASSPQTPLSTTTSVPGYPRPALLSVGSLSVFGMTMASGWTPTLQSIRRPF